LKVNPQDKDFQEIRITDVKLLLGNKNEVIGWEAAFSPITGHRLKATIPFIMKKKPGTPCPRKGDRGRIYFKGAARGKDSCEEYLRGLIINQHVYFYQSINAVREMLGRNLTRDIRALRKLGDERSTEKIISDLQDRGYFDY
jgi:hypothetical protein